jgi:hypothetical protein
MRSADGHRVSYIKLVDRENKWLVEVIEVRVCGNTLTGQVDCMKEWGLMFVSSKSSLRWQY